jgi:hypothetical protein
LSSENETASSSATGIIILVAITLILAALVLLMSFQLPNLWNDPTVPTVFEITKIRHTNPYGILDYDSYMTVKNIGNVAYDNRKLYAKTYRNGELLSCTIPTINGHDFIPLHPHGIQTLGGLGTHDFFWNPDAPIYIDYSKGTFHPGDVVQFEVYDKVTNQIISRDTWPHSDAHDVQWFYHYFLSHQAA